jgi:hypothetical protein
MISSTCLPENLLNKISVADRGTLPGSAKNQMTAAEARSKYEAGQERILQRDIGNFLVHVQRCYVFRQPMHKKTQGRLGCADFLICYRGRWLSVEAKTATGKQRPEQRADQIEVEAAGGTYIVARTVADVQTLLRWIDAEIAAEEE